MPSEDFTYTFALDLPAPNIMEFGPPIFFIICLVSICPRPTKITMGNTQLSKKLRTGDICS